MSKWLVLLLPMIFLLAISMGYANSVTLYPTDDAQIYRTNPNTNYGILDTASSGGVNFQPDQYRGFIKYNISSCIGINSSDVIDVTWYAYEYGGYNFGGIPIHYRKLASSGYGWNESTITWNNQPPITASNIFDFVVTQVQGTEHQANITSFAKSEITSGYDSLTWYGFNENGNDGHGNPNPFMTLYTKEAINQLYKPKLVITYNGTLTCNGTGGGSALQEAHIPSYPNAYQNLKCSAKGTTSENVTYTWYRKASGEGSFSEYSSGTSNVTAGIWKIVNTLSSGSVLPEAQYYCVVSDTGGNVASNTATATDILDLKSAYSPLDASIGDNQYQNVRFNNVGNQTVYAFVECDWLSPSSVHYYPNDTSILYGCKQVAPNIFPNGYYQMKAYKIMTETGTWNGKSCFLYASNYSDCRAEDLGIQDYTLNETFWEVSATPSITNISITPANPKMNETMTCSVRAVTNDNTSTIDQLWNYFLINEAFVTSDYQSSVTNNTITNFTLNIGGLVEVGDNVSCGAFGVKLSPYAEGGIAYSSSVVVRSARVTNISTIPEPQNVGIQKLMYYQTEIPTCSLRVEWEAPSGATGMTKMGSGYCNPVTTNHADAILYNMSFSYDDTLVFTENGLYKYTIKACNCDVDLPADFDNPSFCPQEYCAVPSSYPTKSYGMRWTVSSNYYLYNATANNADVGDYVTFDTLFSKPSSVFKTIVHFPDGSVKSYFVTNMTAITFNSGIQSGGRNAYIRLFSGTGGELDQIGNYTVDMYGGYGWVSNVSNCLEFSECLYTNSSLGIPFNVTVGTGGYIANVTTSPSIKYFETDMNISFDTSNITDETCARIINSEGTSVIFKKITNASTTHWNIPVSSGEGKPINNEGTYTFSLLACKKNGTASCIDDSGASCGTVSANCAYCMNSFGSDYSLEITGGAISSVIYKKQIAVGETQVVSFNVYPYTNNTWVRILSHIVGQPDVYVNSTRPNTFTNWTVAVPYTSITQAICKTTTIDGMPSTSCGYGGVTFEVGAYVNGEWVRKGSENGEYFSFDINTSSLLSPDKKENGTIFGEMIGQAVGLSGIYGDMILALMFSSVLACAMGVLSKEPIITILAFLTSLSIFSLAGMLPFWIIVIQVLFAGFLLMRFLSTVFTGND